MGDANSSFITTLTHVIKNIWSLPWARYAALLISSIALPLRTLWIPFSYLARGLQALFAPAAHVLSYVGGWAAAAAGFLVSLEVMAPLRSNQQRPRNLCFQIYSSTCKRVLMKPSHRIATVHIRKTFQHVAVLSLGASHSV